MARTASTPRESWIGEGLRELATGGPEAVRIEPLAKSLGVSKGSFYWHFTDRGALLDALLDAWERTYVDDAIAQVEADGGDGRTRLRDLFGLAETSSAELLPLDLAIREWARRDPRVMARLTRVDNRRMDFLRLLFSEFARDADDVEARSLLVFSVWVGQPLIAAEHGSRSRRDAVRAALDFVLT